ncbi:MAG: dockerin type I domain-containing protein [Oscillospiraceae bacterium]
MKKVFKITLLVTALALAMTVSAAASYTDFAAAKAAGGTEITPIGGQYTVTATNSTASEAQCVVLVLKGLWEDKDFTNSTVPLAADSILYIDQQPVPAKAGATDGTATFTVYPKSLPDSTVILTGLSEKPQVVGYTEGKGVTVSGKVEFFGPARMPTVTIQTAGGEQIGRQVTAASGAYTIEGVPEAADYKVIVTRIGHLTYTKTGVSVTSGVALPEINIEQCAGDVNDNGKINVYDLTALLGEFNANGAGITVAGADIDAGGKVNVYDLKYLLNNFNKVNISE